MHILRACRRMFFHSFHVTRRPWNNVCSVDILLSTFHLNFSLLRVVENFCPTIYLVLCIFAKPVQHFCTMPTIFIFVSCRQTWLDKHFGYSCQDGIQLASEGLRDSIPLSCGLPSSTCTCLFCWLFAFWIDSSKVKRLIFSFLSFR